VKDEEKTKLGINPNNEDEMKLAVKAISDQEYAEAHKQEIMEILHDEYYMYIGRHWDTKIAPRSEEGKKNCYNSVDNYIFPTINNMRSALTANMPEVKIKGIERDDDYVANKLENIVAHVVRQNKFPRQWRRIVDQFIQYGPAIGMVTWDNDWVGGSGPNRWIGEVKVQYVKKEEIYFDPAILDLEERLQDCSYIHRKLRKKLPYFKERFGDIGELVVQDYDMENRADSSEVNEGADPQQATLIERWRRGKPDFISKAWKDYFNEKADTAEMEDKPWKAQEYRDKAKGILKGVHVAYIANNMTLEYIPYVYEDGLYPFVFRVLYHDEEEPLGIGEIRNIKMPQIMYNLADEIQVASMAKQGLNNKYYNEGAIGRTQLDNIRANQNKGGQAFPVNDIQGIKDDVGPRVPQEVIMYRGEKKQVIDSVSQNTAIQQGQSIGSRTPLGVVEELGQRADRRSKEKLKILSEFYGEMVGLIVNRVAEFYTEERQIRIMGEDNAIDREIARATKEIARITNPEEQYVMLQQLVGIIQGQQEPERSMTFSNQELKKSWERETGKLEEFIPEFDIEVKIKDARPDDQNYISNIATMALQLGAIGEEAYWKAILEGKLPRIEDIMAELQAKRQMMAEMGQSPEQPRGTPANLSVE